MDEEEVNMFDYLTIIYKRKFTVLIVFLCCLISALVFIKTAKETGFYRTKMVVQMGVFEGDITPKNDLKEIIKGYVEPSVKEMGTGKETMGWYRVDSVDIKDSNMLEVVVEAEKPDVSKKLCELIGDKAIGYANGLYVKRRAPIIEKIRVAKEEIANIRKNKKDAENAIIDPKKVEQKTTNAEERSFERILSDIEMEMEKTDKIVSEMERVLAESTADETSLKEKRRISDQLMTYRSQKQAYLTMKRSLLWDVNWSYQSAIRDRDNRLGDILRNKADMINILGRGRKFAVINSPSEPEYVPNHSKKEKKVRIIVASVAGVVLGILLAFLQDYWQKNRHKLI